MLAAILGGWFLVGALWAQEERPAQPRPAAAARVGPDELYPDPDLTPGVVDPAATAEKVCTPGYSAKVRHVTEAEKKEVFARYKKTRVPRGQEVDHFISLELGGSNDIRNLWPEPYEPHPGARQKDVVENSLHREVCAGRMTLARAQEIIVTDWYAYYLGLRMDAVRRKIDVLTAPGGESPPAKSR